MEIHFVGLDKILVAICSVLDLYNCSRLVSGVQHIAILQEMVYILFSSSRFLTERFPHQQTRPNVITVFTNESAVLTESVFQKRVEVAQQAADADHPPASPAAAPVPLPQHSQRLLPLLQQRPRDTQESLQDHGFRTRQCTLSFTL